MKIMAMDEHIRMPTALIVDDDTDLLAELSENLRAEDIQTLSVSSPGMVLDLLSLNNQIDAIVTDITMPQIDGLDLLRRLADLKGSAAPPAIVISGAATLDRAVEALRLGAVDFFVKPFDPADLAIAIKRAAALTGSTTAPSTPPRFSDVDFIRGMLSARADRSAVFAETAFGDPGWEIMLDLALCEASRKTISVMGLCHSTSGSPTTALRRLNELEEAGWVARTTDKEDRRRINVSLTEKGSAAMRDFIRRQMKRIAIG